MKLGDVKSNTYINSGKEINNKYRKFKVGYVFRILEYQHIKIFLQKVTFKIGLKWF